MAFIRHLRVAVFCCIFYGNIWDFGLLTKGKWIFRKKIISVFAFLAILSLGVQTSLAHKYEETFERTLDFKSGGKLAFSFIVMPI